MVDKLPKFSDQIGQKRYPVSFLTFLRFHSSFKGPREPLYAQQFPSLRHPVLHLRDEPYSTDMMPVLQHIPLGHLFGPERV